jgi:hypothetical protein
MAVAARPYQEELEAGPASFRLDGTEFREQLQVSRTALAALRNLSALGGDPPSKHASSLLADGLVDVDFGLTERGRRALTPRAAPRS